MGQQVNHTQLKGELIYPLRDKNMHVYISMYNIRDHLIKDKGCYEESNQGHLWLVPPVLCYTEPQPCIYNKRDHLIKE